MKHHVGTEGYRDVSRFVQKVAHSPARSLAHSFARAAASLLPQSQFLQHMLALPFFPEDCRTVTVALSRRSAPRSSLIMNHQRHLPLFIVVRFRLIYRHDSRAYYSRFLFQRLRIYYSAARFHFVFYRRAFVRSFRPSVRKPIDKIHIVTSHRIKSRLTERFRPFAS